MKLHKATLVSRSTKDGWEVVREEVPLGKVYWVDIESIRTGKHINQEHPVGVSRVVINVYDSPSDESGDNDGWMPLEILRIEANA